MKTPSCVMLYRAGRKPLRSRLQQAMLPLVETTPAGPSQGSWCIELNSRNALSSESMSSRIAGGNRRRMRTEHVHAAGKENFQQVVQG